MRNNQRTLIILTASAIALIALATAACQLSITPAGDTKSKVKGQFLKEQARLDEPTTLQVGVSYAPADEATKLAVMDRIRELGGTTGGYDIFIPNPYRNTLVALMPSNRLYDLAKLPQVEGISPEPDNQQWSTNN